MTTAWKPNDGWNPYPDLCVLLPTPESHIDWLLQRREGIGSSDCAAVIGLDRYETALGLWLDKTGQIPLLSDLDSEQAEWGRLLEPVIRDRAAERLGLEVRLCGGLAHRGRPWQRASLDGVLMVEGEPIPIEVKSTSQYLAGDWADDQVPDRAELQVQHQLAVTGAPYGYVAGLIGGNRLVVRRVDRDPELIAHIIREEARLWQHVLDGTPPAVTARESLSVLLGAAGQADTDALVLDDPDEVDQVRAWLAQYAQAGLDEKRALDRKAEARNNLIWKAAGHTQIVDSAGELLCRLQRGVFAAKRFEADEPDTASLYMKKVEVVDSKALRAELPDTFRKYQSVSVRAPKSKEK